MEESRYQEKMKVHVDDWRIPYIGRIVTEEFEQKFRYKDEIIGSSRFVGIHKFEWEGHPDRVKENHFDESNYRHFLSVELFDSGAMKGRVKAIEVHYRNYWHTTSNWQDHGEGGVYEVDVNYENEIDEYCKLLDICTKSCSREEAVEIFRTVVANSNEFDIVDGNLKGPHSLSISVGQMANFITIARSFLEVFFFGALMDDPKDRGLLSEYELNLRDPASDAFKRFLDRIDIKVFYQGMNLDKLKQDFLERMYQQGGMLLSFLGVSQRVYTATMMSMVEERVDSPARKIRLGGRREYFGHKVAYSGNNPVAIIPDGSLCFFNRKRICVGYVTRENKVFKYHWSGYQLLGGLASDGMVYNVKGECLERGWSISANGILCGERRIMHFEDRIEVGCDQFGRNSYKYVGYAMECKYERKDESSSAKCEKYVWAKEEWDMRWIGLAFWGHLDDESLLAQNMVMVELPIR